MLIIIDKVEVSQTYILIYLINIKMMVNIFIHKSINNVMNVNAWLQDLKRYKAFSLLIYQLFLLLHGSTKVILYSHKIRK